MHRSRSKHRGYVILFTLIIISILMIMSLYMFKLELSKKMRNYSYGCIELNEDILSVQREHLLGRLNKFIEHKCTDINEENVSLILNEVNNEKINYEKSFVKYDNKSKNIILNLKDNRGIKVKEIYNFKVDKELNIVKFTYLKFNNK